MSKADELREYEGKLFKTNNYGDLIITKFVNRHTVEVKFVNTGYVTTTRMCQIEKGTVRDRLAPTVCGVGVLGDEVTQVGGKNVKEFSLWRNMMNRCYNHNYHKLYPTYKTCKMSDNFKFYPYFKNWCNEQIGFGFIDDNGRSFTLDKDILIKGNKTYSEDMCCFVPNEVNSLLTKHDNSRGGLLLGVQYNKRLNKYIATTSKFKIMTHIGCFDTEIEAFYAYKEAKESYIKEVANKWKDKIDPRAYDALMNYQVEITD